MTPGKEMNHYFKQRMMLSLYLTSYSLRKDVPEGSGGNMLLSIILALKNKMNASI